MPEVSLWKLKINGKEYSPPAEGEDTSFTKNLTSEEFDKIEFSRQAEDITSWYDLKKKEYAVFETSSRAEFLKLQTQKFLSEQSNIQKFINSLRPIDGISSWFVLLIFFDQCKDSIIIDSLVAEVWESAIRWILHEKHCDITMREMNDLWKNIEENQYVQPTKEEHIDLPANPEYDLNFRYLIPGEDE